MDVERRTVSLPDARPPAGLRLYAIGDVHGWRDAMVEIRRRIDADLEHRPPADWREIWLGDFVDRGDDSCGVIEALTTWPQAARRICLRGNHDDYMYSFLETGDPVTLQHWLANGGLMAFASYGIDATPALYRSDRELASSLRLDLEKAMPAHHRGFLERLPLQVRFGDFGFAHAGLRPGVAWDAQTPRDLMWIRDAFLDHPGPHEVVVVHGHTPTRGVEVRPARICVDTGCGKGGDLSAIVIEDDSIALLEEGGRRPLSLPR
ncbi:MAG: metallophosphoesterase [Pseudomonadota bacterium]